MLRAARTSFLIVLFLFLALLVPISRASAAPVFFDPGRSTAVPPGANYVQARGSTSFQDYLNGLNGERGVVIAYSAGGSYLADQVAACRQYPGGCRFVLVDANNNNKALDPVLQYYNENPQGLKVLCTNGYDSPFCKNSDFARVRTSCGGTHADALNNCNLQNNIGLTTPCPPPNILITPADRAKATAAYIPTTSSCWDPKNPYTGEAAGDAKIYLQKHADPGVQVSCLNSDFAERLAKLMQSVPKPPIITSTFRAAAAQDKAQASGASKLGACQSWHQYGLAADFNKATQDELKVLRLNASKFGLTTIRDATAETGCAMDADVNGKHFCDTGHIQMAGPLPSRDQCMQSCAATGPRASTPPAAPPAEVPPPPNAPPAPPPENTPPPATPDKTRYAGDKARSCLGFWDGSKCTQFSDLTGRDCTIFGCTTNTNSTKGNNSMMDQMMEMMMLQKLMGSLSNPNDANNQSTQKPATAATAAPAPLPPIPLASVPLSSTVGGSSSVDATKNPTISNGTSTNMNGSSTVTVGGSTMGEVVPTSQSPATTSTTAATTTIGSPTSTTTVSGVKISEATSTVQGIIDSLNTTMSSLKNFLTYLVGLVSR